MYSSKISERLKEIRLENGYTQAQLAEILDISNEAYKKIERGDSRISVEKVIMLEEKLNISANYLLFGKRQTLDNAWDVIMDLSEQDRFSVMLRLCTYFSEVKGKRFFKKSDIENVDENVKNILEALNIEG